MATEQKIEKANPQLTIGDLTLTLNLIQACAQRGAFKAEEMSTVGGLYERIYAFLDASGALKKADATPADAAAETKSDAE
ncbi:MAG: hypothetical protein N2235_02900 [Fischerella sp.]|nr:hypothetical protein [Fischerella sp.]